MRSDFLYHNLQGPIRIKFSSSQKASCSVKFRRFLVVGTIVENSIARPRPDVDAMNSVPFPQSQSLGLFSTATTVERTDHDTWTVRPVHISPTIKKTEASKFLSPINDHDAQNLKKPHSGFRKVENGRNDRGVRS